MRKLQQPWEKSMLCRLLLFKNWGFKPCALSTIPDFFTTDIVWPRKEAVTERHVGRWQNTEYCLKNPVIGNLCGPQTGCLQELDRRVCECIRLKITVKNIKTQSCIQLYPQFISRHDTFSSSKCMYMLFVSMSLCYYVTCLGASN